jgi:glutaredoxin-related protein
VTLLEDEKVPFTHFDILTDDAVRQGLKVRLSTLHKERGGVFLDGCFEGGCEVLIGGWGIGGRRDAWDAGA